MALRDTPGAQEGEPTHALASPARLSAAAALRRLGHALVAHEIDDDVFSRITTEVEGLLGEIDKSPARRRPTLEMKRDVFAQAPPDGGSRSHFPDCIVTGAANPMGMAAQTTRAVDDGVLRTTLGAAFEGAPSRAHGGAIAALFDEVMGFVLAIHCTPAYTGRLTVDYRAPAPLLAELEFRARLRSRYGRKLTMQGEARHGEVLIAEAEGIFVAVNPERFAAG
jgi:acyl-coenzyme A thioesterase PaaI-like protein